MVGLVGPLSQNIVPRSVRTNAAPGLRWGTEENYPRKRVVACVYQYTNRWPCRPNPALRYSHPHVSRQLFGVDLAWRSSCILCMCSDAVRMDDLIGSENAFGTRPSALHVSTSPITSKTASLNEYHGSIVSRALDFGAQSPHVEPLADTRRNGNSGSSGTSGQRCPSACVVSPFDIKSASTQDSND